MENIKIKLTLNGVTKEVEASKFDFGSGPSIRVYGLRVVTTSGGKVHCGSARVVINEANEYTLADLRDISYHGMRGNGHARKSRFRSVSHSE